MMKTKNMLWMSALLALLAGCSQGELGTDDTPGKRSRQRDPSRI